MRLSPAAFGTLFGALSDAFTNSGDFSLLARTALGMNLSDVVAANARNPEIVQALIRSAETADAVQQLVAAAKNLNATNAKLQAVDAAQLDPAEDTNHVVDAAPGQDRFKQKLKDALGELDTVGMEAVAGRELAQLLHTADDDDAITLLLALLGTARTDRDSNVLAEMGPVVEASLRRQIGDGRRPDMTISLARVRLPRIDLSDLDLHEADLAFADLTHADLTNANLWRSRAFGATLSKARLSRSNLEECRWHSVVARQATFHDCRMVSTFMKEAELAGAQFERSSLQGAHFEGAALTGARFEQANIADASFRGAIIDDAAAASLAHAKNWEQAHFDPAVRDAIASLAKH